MKHDHDHDHDLDLDREQDFDLALGHGDRHEPARYLDEDFLVMAEGRPQREHGPDLRLLAVVALVTSLAVAGGVLASRSDSEVAAGGAGPTAVEAASTAVLEPTLAAPDSGIEARTAAVTPAGTAPVEQDSSPKEPKAPSASLVARAAGKPTPVRTPVVAQASGPELPRRGHASSLAGLPAPPDPAELPPNDGPESLETEPAGVEVGDPEVIASEPSRLDPADTEPDDTESGAEDAEVPEVDVPAELDADGPAEPELPEPAAADPEPEPVEPGLPTPDAADAAPGS